MASRDRHPTALCTAAFALAALACAWAAGVGRAAISEAEGGVLFSYTDAVAQAVALAGSFNDWNTTANPMSDDDGDGVWTLLMKLAPGRYEYKFVVNGGTWVADPENPLTSQDYGNSVIEVRADGHIGGVGEGGPAGAGGTGVGAGAAPAAIPSGTPAITNTPAHSRVYIGGFFRMLMESASDVEGDARLRLQRPDNQLNLDVTANLNPKLWGSMRFQFHTAQGGANELSADLYKAQSNFIDDHFRIQAYYNEEVFETGDPLELLGHIDLRGTIEREQRQFGQGTQGLVFRADPWGTSLNALYADTYDEDIFNPTAPTVLNPRKEGLNQSTGTDLAVLRWTVPLGERRIGLTYRGEFSDWWVNFTSSQNPYPAELAAFRAADPRRDQDKSDNFELANDRHTVAVDTATPVPWVHNLGARAEAAYVWYDARWDLGNREAVKGDQFVNGHVHIPIGNENGYRGKLELNHRFRDFSTTLSHQIRYGQGMDAGENFVTYRTVPGSEVSDRDYWVDQTQVSTYYNVNGTDALDVLRLGPRPKRLDHDTRLDMVWTRGPWDVVLQYERLRENLDYRSLFGGDPATLNRWTWRTSPRIRWRPFKSPTHFIGLQTEFVRTRDPVEFAQTGAAATPSPMPGQGNGELLRLNSSEWILRGLLPGWKLNQRDISVRVDLRWIGYSGDGQLTDTNGKPLDLNQDFFAPFLGLVYHPADAVLVQAGYGVDPTFYNVISAEGWPNGREQFRENYLFDLRLDPYAPLNVLQAERALADRHQIVLTTLITF